MTTPILLDFDGVVFNNKAVFQKIRTQSARFVQETHSLSFRSAQRLNKSVYMERGHSVFATGKSIDEYNDFVFDEHMIDSELYHLYDREDTMRLRNLKAIKERYKLNLILCTNTPMRYCERILSLSGMKFTELFSEDYSFTSDKLQSLKPQNEFFEHIEDQLPFYTIHFFDDSVLNMEAASKRKRWNAVLFDPEDIEFDCFTDLKNTLL